MIDERSHGSYCRSISLIVPLIDLDIEAKNFLQAQMKIDVINEIFKSSVCLADEECVAKDEYEKLMSNLKLPKLSVEVSSSRLSCSSCHYTSNTTWIIIFNWLDFVASSQRLESVSELKWAMKRIDIESTYYRNRSEKVVSALMKDLREGFDKQEFCVPEWARHHFSCFCYICSHPDILPVTYHFLFLQVSKQISFTWRRN
jgi:hypothetical protein